MKKIIRVFAALVILVVAVLGAFPQGVWAQSTVASSVSSYNWPYQHHSLDIAGYQYSFYSDGANEYVKSSLDGVVWGNATLVRAGVMLSYQFSVCAWGNYFYYEYKNQYFRMGQVSSGNISWVAAEQSTGLVADPYSTIAVDGLGYPWLGYIISTSSHAVQCTYNNGTWATLRDDVIYTSSGAANIPLLVTSSLYTDHSMTVIAALNNNSSPLLARIFNGNTSTWGAVIWGSSHVAKDAGNSLPEFSCVVNPDHWGIDCVFNEVGSHDIIYTELILGAFDTEQVIQAGASAFSWPVITATTSNWDYCFWEHSPNTNSISYSQGTGPSGSMVWHSPIELIGNQTLLVNGAYEGAFFGCTERSYEDAVGVYFEINSGALLYVGLYEGGTRTAIIDDTLDVTMISDITVQLNGECIWDGGSPCTAYFYLMSGSLYSYGYVAGNVTGIITGETYSVFATNLIPDMWYSCWQAVVNGNSTLVTNVVFFKTAAAASYYGPVVVTVNSDNVTSTSATIKGLLSFDGGLDCQVGFEYKLHTSGTWIIGWISGLKRSNVVFTASLSGLTKNMDYDFRAIAKNSMGAATPGVTMTFSTGVVTMPTPSPGGGVVPAGLIPSGWSDAFRNLSSSVKLVLALMVTIGGMFFIATKLPRDKSAGIVVIAYGLASVLGFSVFGWFPGYVIIIIDMIVALLILLTVLGGGGKH